MAKFHKVPMGTTPRSWKVDTMNDEQKLEIEAAVFRKLRDHLQDNTDVQNIDLMILADFCRNCLSKWYNAAAEDLGVDIEKDDSREAIYGMPYAEWKAKHQTPATQEQLDAMAARKG
jgi:hypothetical protein